LREGSVWALVKNRSVVFQEAVDGAPVLPRQRPRRGELREMLDQFPLDGTLPDWFSSPRAGA
jgi:hypothetical protein